MVLGAVSNPFFSHCEQSGQYPPEHHVSWDSSAFGVGLALMAGEIDISVGSILGLASVVAALLLKAGYGVPVAAGAPASVWGLACGFRQRRDCANHQGPRQSSSTLATLGIYRAFALVLANGSAGWAGCPTIPRFSSGFGQGRDRPKSPISPFLFLIVAFVAEVALRFTSSGFQGCLRSAAIRKPAHLIGFRVERNAH